MIVDPVVKDNSCTLAVEESELRGILSVKNPGCLGSGSVISLHSISTTVGMLGLSSGCGCTHNNPICRTRRTSEGLHSSTISSATSSKKSPSLYSFHACVRLLDIIC